MPSKVPPKYASKLVEETMLIEIIEQHPLRLTIGELVLRIVADPDDSREVETATEAIRNLRRSVLVRYRDDDDLVEPTQAARFTPTPFSLDSSSGTLLTEQFPGRDFQRLGEPFQRRHSRVPLACLHPADLRRVDAAAMRDLLLRQLAAFSNASKIPPKVAVHAGDGLC
jgi:hypothetical protein